MDAARLPTSAATSMDASNVAALSSVTSFTNPTGETTKYVPSILSSFSIFNVHGLRPQTVPSKVPYGGGCYRVGVWRLQAFLVWRQASRGNISRRLASTKIEASASTLKFSMRIASTESSVRVFHPNFHYLKSGFVDNSKIRPFCSVLETSISKFSLTMVKVWL